MRKIVSYIFKKITEFVEYSKFELRRITIRLIDNCTHNGFLCTVGGMNCIHVEISGALGGTLKRQNLIVTSKKVL